MLSFYDIKKLKKCPYCGSTFGYYQRMYVSGWIHENTLFENGEPYNSEQFDHLNYSRESKYFFCINCNKRISKTK